MLFVCLDILWEKILSDSESIDTSSKQAWVPNLFLLFLGYLVLDKTTPDLVMSPGPNDSFVMGLL